MSIRRRKSPAYVVFRTTLASKVTCRTINNRHGCRKSTVSMSSFTHFIKILYPRFIVHERLLFQENVKKKSKNRLLCFNLVRNIYISFSTDFLIFRWGIVDGSFSVLFTLLRTCAYGASWAAGNRGGGRMRGPDARLRKQAFQ